MHGFNGNEPDCYHNYITYIDMNNMHENENLTMIEE